MAAEYGLCIKFSKCQFMRREVTFLGHILEKGTIQPSQEKSNAIRYYPEPKTIKQVQSFLGLAEYFRKFVPNFSVVAKPLTALTKKDATFRFGVEQREAFAHLKGALCAKPILQVYDTLMPAKSDTVLVCCNNTTISGTQYSGSVRKPNQLRKIIAAMT